MNIVLTVVNNDVNLASQQVLAYLKPQGSNSDWLSSAWAACSPQTGGGSSTLPAITNDVEAYATWSNNMNKTAMVSIPNQYMSTISQSGNVVQLGQPVLDATDLTAQQSGVTNTTSITDMYVVWCVNNSSVCKPANPMMNTGISSFELTQSVYFTIGSQTKTQTFIVQNWTALSQIPLASNLVSADIVVAMNKSTNTPTFTITNQKYS
ncbi:hypothetical protein F6R98_13325 [Candidatus Methylospira mobilis]|uniref:Uncharacterized protein n=1 Tax=Candidatus Methylospira mobilis TaxID=1808979 RepID=A0A5Q0BMY3_9GAMM|nr:hypothetical protein [Candidatus Methylospira mobilis]QFY43478.1 hypothetical protein F6R98_13325 [Candidatus Methylospira mobilis]WNV03980.1 hypothetical protein RP726_16330 [Candidatus Methylospira mobilis]